jgi:hypothetical protein
MPRQRARASWGLSGWRGNERIPSGRSFATSTQANRDSAETVPSSSRRALPDRKLQFTIPFISSPLRPHDARAVVSQSLQNRFGIAANTGNLRRCIGRLRSARNVIAPSLQNRTSKGTRHDHISRRSFKDVWSKSGHVASTRLSPSRATRHRRETPTMTMITRTKTKRTLDGVNTFLNTRVLGARGRVC